MIPDILEKRALECPDKYFIDIYGELFTYVDFNLYVNSIISSNIIPSKAKRVAINVKSDKMKIAYLIACNRLGVIPVILPPGRLMAEDCKQISDADCEISENNCSIQVKKEKKYYHYHYNDNDVQCVLFTSGSLGKPKGVELTFSNIYNSAINWSKIYSFNKNDIYLNILPIHHISGLSIFFRSLYFNFHSIITDYNNNKILNLICEKQVTCLSIVPKMLYDLMIIKSTEDILKNIKFLLIGGDSILKKHFNYLKNNNINAYVSYGATETCSGIAGYWVADQVKFSPGFIGSPHLNVQLSVNNEFLQVASNTVMKRYCRDSLSDKVLIMEDKVKIVSGKFYFTGKLPHKINTGGENVNLKYMQNLFDECNLRNEVVVTSLENIKWGDIIVLAYKSSCKDIEFIDEIDQLCEKSFPDFMHPKYIVNIPEIPKHANKKNNYKKIKNYIKDYI